MTIDCLPLPEILEARRRIAGLVERTPCGSSAHLSERAGVPVHLKMEHRQTTGSFKLRGASNAIVCLSPEKRANGVVTASTGNHDRVVAYAAAREGIPATVCMSDLVPQNKVDEIRRLGAEIRIVGKSQDDAQEEVDRLVAEKGMAMVSPFDAREVIAGQGTLGFEIMEDVPEAACVVVPLSGGGLIAGVASAVKVVNPKARIVGISMERGPAMKASLDAGHPVQVEEEPSLADSLGGGIGLDNRFTFSICRALVDEVILLTEEEIASGIRHAYASEREVLEGAGAVGIAAFLSGKLTLSSPGVLVLSGRNIDMDAHREIVCAEPRQFRDQDQSRLLR
ncbi:hydroxyectoine utilization dehydratase EutB [Breoghania sp.]|uniref:hydroxyectoine utilization dehydratase EutB n=1 Tax=Breoghania sp. TaxID=2065378 RepID=UPI002601ECC7|nr:hydroxyectoine utilization dehydratase EutB [Breoghania sp.]MDJ0931872.1 hydroxyectoine utilization dehydratase EutB [Breoghania sp.]